MALSVTSASPSVLSGVVNANPGTINGVGVAQPGVLSGVVNAQPPRLTTAPAVPQVTPAQSQQQLLSQALSALRPAAPAPIDIAAINAQARKQAEESVNPLYTKKLNDLLAREAVKRQRAQADNALAIQTLEDNLKRTQENNATDRTRTTEDVATNLGQINTLADRYQTASGQQFEDQRLANAVALANSGLSTSGIGRQQVQRAIDDRNTAEKQQTEDFQAQRVSQEVAKARTFEDLAKSDILAGENTEKGKAAAKLDLDRLLEDIGSEEEAGKFDIEQSRIGDIANKTSDYSQLGFNNYLAGIRDPRVLEATAQAYGGLF